VVICVGQAADLHMDQLIPLPLTVSCSRKSRLVLILPSGNGSPGSPGQNPESHKMAVVVLFMNFFSLVILVPDINISRTTTLEFQDFSRVFQNLCLFPGLSRPVNLGVLIPGLSRVCMNPSKLTTYSCTYPYT